MGKVGSGGAWRSCRALPPPACTARQTLDRGVAVIPRHPPLEASDVFVYLWGVLGVRMAVWSCHRLIYNAARRTLVRPSRMLLEKDHGPVGCLGSLPRSSSSTAQQPQRQAQADCSSTIPGSRSVSSAKGLVSSLARFQPRVI